MPPVVYPTFPTLPGSMSPIAGIPSDKVELSFSPKDVLFPQALDNVLTALEARRLGLSAAIVVVEARLSDRIGAPAYVVDAIRNGQQTWYVDAHPGEKPNLYMIGASAGDVSRILNAEGYLSATFFTINDAFTFKKS